jgi:hypothetical protein
LFLAFGFCVRMRLVRAISSVASAQPGSATWTTCRLKRWEHEAVVEAMQQRLDQKPDMMRIRRQTVEHPFGTLKFWMGAAHFLMKTREHVSTEMSLHVLAYNLRRVMAIFGTGTMLQKIRA